MKGISATLLETLLARTEGPIPLEICNRICGRRF